MAGPPDALAAALERLYGRERGNKGPFTLDGTRALLDALGRPEAKFPSVHVAGTNGKGSTCSMLERCLRAAGARTGLFTSPHLVDFRERIRIDGRWADAAATAARLDRIAALPASEGRTFFEATFALGALTFAEEAVDIAVLETGLGGRLDSTNAVRHTALSVITPVGMDHMDLLGDTLEAIAAEKAGIVKRNSYALVAPQPPAARAVIEARARDVDAWVYDVRDQARLVRVERVDRTGSRLVIELEEWGETTIHLRLLGRHQWTNALTAAAAFRLLDWTGTLRAGARSGEATPRRRLAQVAEGLSYARWPGRCEASRHEPRLYWDGAHNADGARVLREAWRDFLDDPPVALVLGFATDKDARAMIDALREPVRRVFAVAAQSPRAATPAQVAELVRERMPGVPVTACDSVAEGVRAALGSLAPDEFALACGSLFVVGEAMFAAGETELAQL